MVYDFDGKELKVGDEVKFADTTHFHYPDELRGRLEIIAVDGPRDGVIFQPLVAVSPISTKKEISFHVDDVFSHKEWVPANALWKLRRRKT